MEKAGLVQDQETGVLVGKFCQDQWGSKSFGEELQGDLRTFGCDGSALRHQAGKSGDPQEPACGLDDPGWEREWHGANDTQSEI